MEKSDNRRSSDHTIHLRVSSSLFEKLKSCAMKEERSVSGMVKFMIGQFQKINPNCYD